MKAIEFIQELPESDELLCMNFYNVLIERGNKLYQFLQYHHYLKYRLSFSIRYIGLSSLICLLSDEHEGCIIKAE